MTKRIEKILKSTMAAGASFGALVVDSMAESGRGTIDIELENGSKVTFLEFDYLDKATSKLDVWEAKMQFEGKDSPWTKYYNGRQYTEYQLPGGILLVDRTSIKSYDENHENIFHTSRAFSFIEDKIRAREGKVFDPDDVPANTNRGKGILRIESDIKWSLTLVSIFDVDFNNLYSVVDFKYDLEKPQRMSMTHYSNWYSENSRKKGIKAGQYFSLAPSKTTKPLEEFVPLVDGLLEKMYPKKNGRIMTIPGLTMNKDILWGLADVDVSHIQRRVRNETAKNQQPKRDDAMLAASQGKTPAYTTSATVPDQVVSDMKKHARKTEDSINEANKKRLEELMREIQAEGGSVSQTSPKKKVSGQSIVPAEAVLASTRQPKTK